MSKERGIIISDFDGTVTDNSKEAQTYASAYFEQMSHLTGMNEQELTDLVSLAAEEIRGNPGIYGWTVDGLIVAPVSDPYVFTTATMQLIAKQQNLTIPEEAWGRIHKNSYAKTGVSFKPEAKEYLNELQQTGRLAVVTNSHTDAVLQKLNVLFGEHDIRVIGEARKHEIDRTWEVVPMTSQYPGFPRPVNLRRKSYSDKLDSLGKIDWVVGDIYELDLALPEARGMGTVLVTADHTPAHELDHYQMHENGFKSDSLLEVLSRIL